MAFGGTHEKNEVPIIYATITGEPKRVLKFSWMNHDQGIKSFERWNHTFLYVSGLKSDDIGDSLNQILDELFEQLK